MGLFDNWPYSDVHQLNLDWILKVIKEVKEKMDLIDQTVSDLEGYVTSCSDSADLAEGYKNQADGYQQDAKDYRDGAKDWYDQTLALVSGSPKVVDLAADMTDENIIYVYVGSEEGYVNGDWYYYDGNAWVDGGAYGSTGGMSDNARNLLKYILDRAVYTEPDMNSYIIALYNELAEHGGVTPAAYTITNALSNVTNSNSATGCNEGDSYSAVLTADTGYDMVSVTVTMGGVDITSTAYDSLTGAITINYVDGDIVITASASLPANYEIVGNPTIVDNVMTPSLNNFIKTPAAFSPGSNPWKIVVKYRYTTAVDNADIVGSVTSANASAYGLLLEMKANKTPSGYISGNGSSWNVTSNLGFAYAAATTANTWIWSELKFTGSQYTIRYSTDGSTYSEYGTLSSSSTVKDGYQIAFGLKRNAVMQGQIDLSECKIWVNDTLWWSAV